MPLITETLAGAKNTKYILAVGIGGLSFDSQSATVHLCDDWYLNAKEICEVKKFSAFAGMRKGKKKGVWPITYHEKIPCNLNVIAVRKTNGWLFFCDSKDNYMRLLKELRGKDSKDGKVKVSNELFDDIKCLEPFQGAFYAHVGMEKSYKTTRSREVCVGEKWVTPGDDMIPELESVYETEYYDDVYQVPEDLRKGMPSQALCVDGMDFEKLYQYMTDVQDKGQKRKQAEEEAHREQEEADRAERERQEKERREREEAERLTLWNQRKREKVEQLKQERQRKSKEQLQEERKKRAAGKAGEKEVEYVIKWLTPKKYYSVPKRPCVKFDDEAILLWNPDFIDEPQEYDHIVLGQQGVFLIETKNYRGTLAVNRDGIWIRIKDGVEEGVPSPVQQLRRHEKLLRSILPNRVPIIPIICIAHPEVIIKGASNCSVPLVKSDLLGDYIESRRGGHLSESDIRECLTLIERYRLE